MTDDPRVETWIAWLDAGVTLRVPETSIPYCDVHESTLRALGAGLYERADTWSAFEAGHGRYGSTDATTLNLAALRAALATFAAHSPERVRPRDDVDAAAGVDAAEALALARDGRRSISPWYASSNRELTSAIVGGDGEAYCVTSRGAAVVQVDRLARDNDARLRGLLVRRAALVAADPSRAARARAHCARRDALVAELRGDARKALAPRGEKRCTKAGAHAAGVVYFESNRALLVRPMDERELFLDVAQCLLRDESLATGPVDDETFERVHPLEAKVVALIEGLTAGQIAYQRNTSIATWWAWLDGAACALTVREGRPVAVTDDEVEVPSFDCASYVCAGSKADSFHPIDEAFRDAARALVAARTA